MNALPIIIIRGPRVDMRTKNKTQIIADKLVESKFLKSKSGRTADAVKWRLKAYSNTPELANLIRPIPISSTEKTSRATTSKYAQQMKKSETKPVQHRFKWGSSYFDEPVQNNVVFYESFSGNGALCNPLAMFEELLHDSSMTHLKHVWALRDSEDIRAFNAEYARFKNVRVVRFDSVDYWKTICTAKYLINNATFPPYFTKRPEQVYVNAWHGTPLKKMGYAANEGAVGAKNIVRNFMQADFLISPNSFTTENMYLNGYKLDGLFRGTILEEGYPRIDAQFGSQEDKLETRRRIERAGARLTGKPIVLYAPTWKGADFSRPKQQAKELLQIVEEMRDRLGNRYDILLKVHQQIFAQTHDVPKLKDFLVPNSVPTNYCLAIVDVLITDYSSIFFDFLALDKPIIFYTPDKESYTSLRGVYLENLPGPETPLLDQVITDLGDYADGVRDNRIESFNSVRREAKQLYCSQEDGSATTRIIDIIFKGKTACNSQTILKTKKTILIYLGGMRNNGITNSALNLLSNIDHSIYDVSIWAPQPGKDNPVELYKRIPAEVRQFLRVGSHPLTADRFDAMSKFLNESDFIDSEVPKNVKEVFQAEWQRSFGDAEFDYIVDFSGYAGFWSFVLLEGNAKISRSVWQHSDLVSDRDREINGQKGNVGPLNSQFNSYKFFDNVVSVSNDLMKINRDSFQSYAHRNAFRSCRNTLNAPRIQSALVGPPQLVEVGPDQRQSVDQLVDSLLDAVSKQELIEAIELSTMKSKIFINKEVKRFVTAGRLSPEKNQARLIRAFSKVHNFNHDTQLVILGDGPLRSELESLVSELGLSEAVIFTGMVDNPLEIMRDCDCFVISSDYEGQPMVILEAAAMKLPIISVAFGSVASAMNDSMGIVVEQNSDALAEGMVHFLEHGISFSDFDFVSYNRDVMKDFYSIIG
ncbi:glycosyltransferase [Glutamicibacter protophormiae]|uniref:glycosyltransferase n=1 Tax=Glutamicibacter protophormiae TaxID=37930 RepID=UPI00332A7C0D